MARMSGGDGRFMSIPREDIEVLYSYFLFVIFFSPYLSSSFSPLVSLFFIFFSLLCHGTLEAGLTIVRYPCYLAGGNYNKYIFLFLCSSNTGTV